MVKMKCKICSSEYKYFATAKLLNKYDVEYFQCPNCGFIQTETPYWLKEAYSEGITSSDIGLVSRNIQLARLSRVLISALFNPEAKFLDYGGGYGLLVRIMRDSGFDFYLWDKFTPNLFAKGFEAALAVRDQYELVTAFEVFEHFVNPLEDIDRMLTFSRNVLFSTLLVPPHNPKPENWWYYGLEHGQHVSLYTRESLLSIAKNFSLNLITNGNSLHLFTEKEISPLLFRFLSQSKVVRLLDLLRKRDSLLAKDYFQITGKRLI